MPNEGLFSSVGKHTANASPAIAKAALSLPAAFARWAQGLFKRLRREENILLLFVSAAVIGGGVIFPLSIVQDVFRSGATSNEFYTELSTLYRETVSRLQSGLTNTEVFWVGVAAVAALAILPAIVRLYVRILFWTLGSLLQGLIYIFSGYWSHPFDEMNSANGAPKRTTNAPAAQAQSQNKKPDDRLQARTPDSVNLIETARPKEGQVSNADAGTRIAGLREGDASSAIDRLHDGMTTRIHMLLKDIRSREEINLGVGILFSVLGVIALAAFVLFGGRPPSSSDKMEFIFWFIPKLTIAIFIQVFAYFFLGLYRANLIDIKYFNNELTNMEYKKIAADIALKEIGKRTALRDQICLELLKTERNFVLKKGETTSNFQDTKDKAETVGDFKNELLGAIKELKDLVKK